VKLRAGHRGANKRRRQWWRGKIAGCL
jgi:hypothetical protein